MTVSNDLRFRVSGPHAEALASAVRVVLDESLGAGARVVRDPGAGPTQPVSRDIDALAVATFIVALPGTALAAVDLPSRLQLRARVERALSRLRDTTASQPSHQVEMRSGAMWQHWQPIEEMAAEDVMAARDKDGGP